MREQKPILPAGRELRVAVTYRESEIDSHLRKLRLELAGMKEVTEPSHIPGTVRVKKEVTGLLGAIHMLEDMKRRGGKLEVFLEEPRPMTEREAVKISDAQL